MTQINIKRVYDIPEPTDGFRVLVDKLWPRGMTEEKVDMDFWAKGLTPSTQLREWYHQDPESRWESFKKLYLEELKHSPAITTFLDEIRNKKTVTLLYASKDAVENHAMILQQYLEDALRSNT